MAPVIDLGTTLSLDRPGVYPVRVEGGGFEDRGVRNGDILIVNTAAAPTHGKLAIALSGSSTLLVKLEKLGRQWRMRRGDGFAIAGGAAEIWGVVTGLVREAA